MTGFITLAALVAFALVGVLYRVRFHGTDSSWVVAWIHGGIWILGDDRPGSPGLRGMKMILTKVKIWALFFWGGQRLVDPYLRALCKAQHG